VGKEREWTGNGTAREARERERGGAVSPALGVAATLSLPELSRRWNGATLVRG
jgi:hypothetical protein